MDAKQNNNGFDYFVKRNGLQRIPRTQAMYAYKVWLNRNFDE